MEIIKFIFNLLLPERCILCGNINTNCNNMAVCKECEAVLLPFISDMEVHLCSHCGMPLISETIICLRCRSVEKNFTANRSLFKYSGEIKELIYQYKFQGRKNISFLFAGLIADTLLRNNTGTIIVPVPGRKIVKRVKGWEHIDLIGKILKHKYKLPVKKLLRRSGRKAQKTLTSEKRAINLRNTIKLSRNIKNIPESIILLDDVFTTGTTINECAGVLKSAGVREIHSLTIAID